MTTYRQFEIRHEADACRIIEHGPTSRHPMNWSGAKRGDGSYFFPASRENAWAAARSQAKPVIVECRGEQPMDLGVVFDVEAFERAAYRGYVSYGYSMSDGYYGPLDFDSWAAGARRDMTAELAGHNDAAPHVKAALPLYLERTATTPAAA